MYNPMLNQQMAQLDQEYAQRKANLMQSFYNQPQISGWGQQNTQTAQPAQPQTQTQNQNVNWVYVSGVDGAKNQIVQPGQTAWMMDNNDPYFYVKSVDGVGSSTFRIFQFTEVQDVSGEQQVQPQIDMSGYVQRDEFEQLKNRIEQFTNQQRKPQNKPNKGVESNG